MPRELKNARITHVSYVDKGANKKKFFLTKSEQESTPIFEKQVRLLTKNEDEQRLVYGVVYEPDIVDAHGDFMTAEEIEKAAHEFMKEYRNIDTQHNFESGAGEVVESYVALADMNIGEEVIKKGSWVLVTRATEEVWESIKKGEITGYSMAGTAEVEEVAKEETDSQMSKFFKMVKDFFSGTEIEKGELKETFNETTKRRNLFDALSMFEDYVVSQLWNDNPSVDKLREYAQDLIDIFSEIINSPDFMKSLQKEYEEREELSVKKEELQAILKEALEPITSRLDSLEKQEEEVKKEEEVVDENVNENPEVVEGDDKEDDFQKQLEMFKDVVKEAIEPIEKRLETVEKARGISKSADTDEAEKVQKSEGGIFDNLFTV